MASLCKSILKDSLRNLGGVCRPDGAMKPRRAFRRLNRVDYESTVCDPLGINVNLTKERLPENGSADGFDNAGAANHMSSFLTEKY
jgi:hypothetical protein